MTDQQRQLPFVGRDRELSRLRERLSAALAGDGGLLVVEGEPGIGKTRLVAEVAREAEARGARVVWGRAYEASGAAPFRPWVQVLRAALADPAAPADPLAEEERAVLAEAIPDLRRPGDAPALPAGDAEAVRYRFYDTVATVLRRLAAASPLVIVLDDVQWFDPSSLGLLHVLAERLHGARLLAIATRRPPDGATVEGHDPLAGAARLRLDGLDAPDVERLVVSVAEGADAGALAAALSRETDGNPFAVTEIVRLLAADGRLAEPHAEETWRLAIPDGVRDLVRLRLAPLSPACRDLLDRIAVLGGEVRLATLERVSDLPPDAVVDALDEAALAHLAEPAPGRLGRYRIAHDLIRQVLYDDLPPGRRARMHQRAGEAIEQTYAADLDPYLAALAQHFYQAAPLAGPAKAIAYARRAGEQAARAGAYEDAVALYARALEALDLEQPADEGARCDLLIALGEAQDRAGRVEDARASLQRAAALAAHHDWPERLARAALAFGGHNLRVDAPDAERIALLQDALERMDESDTAARARLMARLALSLVFTDDVERAASLSIEAAMLARRAGEQVSLATALLAHHYLRWGPREASGRLALATEVASLAEAAGATELALQGERWRLADLLALGDIVAVDDGIARFAARAERTQQPYFRWHAALLRAMRALLAGALAEAEAAMAEALALGRQARNPEAEVYFGFQLLQLRHQQGRRGELVDAVRAFTAAYPTLPGIRAALAFCLAGAGQVDAGRAELHTAAADVLTAPVNANRLSSLVMLAEACADLGATDLAGPLYEQLAPYHGEVGVVASAVNSVGCVSYFAGRLAEMLGRADEARPLFEEAVAVNARVGAATPLVDSQTALADVLLRGGHAEDRRRAEQLLEQAVAAARSLGLVRAEAKAAAMLRAARATPGGSEVDALRSRLADAEERAATDPLTGLPNRAAWDARLATAARRMAVGGARVALALLDLDHFKRVNDTHGHVAGDHALRAAAALIRETLGDDTFLARFGGEEFAALLDADTPAALHERLERVRAAFHRTNDRADPPPGWHAMTVSIGAALGGRGDSAETLFLRADQALYAAKHAGRDTVRVAGARPAE